MVAQFPHRVICLIFVVCLFSAVASGQDQRGARPDGIPGPAPLKGLMIAGGCCHDYPNQIQILTEGISQRVNIEWEIVRGFSPRDRKLPIYQTEDWAQGYDVVVHNECYGGVVDVDFVERIVRGHRKHGIPVVAIHCSMHSYRNAKTDAWRELLGVTSMRHEKQVNDGVEVINRAPGHPIMQGFDKSWRTPKGELYVIEKQWPNLQTLATAFGVQTQQNHPCIWTNEVAGCRVFGTTLGHHNETMLCDEYLDVVSRGLLWACGKIQDSGQPEPGYSGTGEREIVLPGMIPPQQTGAGPTPASWADSVAFPASEKPVALFNGTNLEGWKGNLKYWSVDNGIVVAKNSSENAPKASTYLLTRKNYRNFRLIFEGRLVTSKMHSGIALWGQPVEKSGDPNSYRGHLVMFPGSWGFWDLYRRNSIFKDDGSAQAADRVGDWNRMEILAIGSRIRLVVNGTKVADWSDPQPDLCQSGPIGLQLHSNNVAQEVQFRGLRLSENPSDRLISIKQK